MKTDNNKRDRPSGIPDKDPSKAMDSRKEVEQSNDEKTDQDFPGYPHYPAREDIMDQRTGAHQVDMDVENLPSGHNATGVSQRFVTAQEGKKAAPDSDPQDEQEEELKVLNSREEEIGLPQNVSNEDLGEDLAGTDAEDVAEESIRQFQLY